MARRKPLVNTSGAITELASTDSVGGFKDAYLALPANNIDLSAAEFFSKTISGATTLTVSNVPAAPLVGCFVLDLTNGGSAVITWWSGIKVEGGTMPTLTTAGRDALGFYTCDGGTTWTMTYRLDVK